MGCTPRGPKGAPGAAAPGAFWGLLTARKSPPPEAAQLALSERLRQTHQAARTPLQQSWMENSTGLRASSPQGEPFLCRPREGARCIGGAARIAGQRTRDARPYDGCVCRCRAGIASQRAAAGRPYGPQAADCTPCARGPFSRPPTAPNPPARRRNQKARRRIGTFCGGLFVQRFSRPGRLF